MMLFDNTMVFSRLSNEDSYLVDGRADDPCQHGGVDGRKDGPLPGAAFVFDSGNGGHTGEIDEHEEQEAECHKRRNATSRHLLVESNILVVIGTCEGVVVGK